MAWAKAEVVLVGERAVGLAGSEVGGCCAGQVVWWADEGVGRHVVGQAG
jgi:hypothetical protein